MIGAHIFDKLKKTIIYLFMFYKQLQDVNLKKISTVCKT